MNHSEAAISLLASQSESICVEAAFGLPLQQSRRLVDEARQLQFRHIFSNHIFDQFPDHSRLQLKVINAGQK